jgi:ATP-dependent Clp protease protease subunit
MSEQEEVQRKLLVDRVIAIFEPIDDGVAERAIGQLLYLEELDPDKEMTLSLSTAGGSVPAGLQILKTLGQLGPPLRTVCLDRCGGIATLLLAAGARGKRTARKHARISLDELEQTGPVRGKIVELLAALTGQPLERIAKDMTMSLELTAEGARRYGIVDEVWYDAAP